MSYSMSEEEKERAKQKLKEYYERENMHRWAWRTLKVSIIIYLVLAFIAGWYVGGWGDRQIHRRIRNENKALYNAPLYQIEVIKFGGDKVGFLKFNQRTGVGNIFYVDMEDWYKSGFEEVIPYAPGDNPYD